MNHIFYQQAFHQQCTIKIHSNDNTSLCFESGTWCLYVHSQLRCIQGEMLVTSVSFIPITVKPTTRVSAVFPYQSRSTQHLVPSMGEGGLLAINYRKPTRSAGKPSQWHVRYTARRMPLCHTATWPASGLFTHEYFQVCLSNCGPPFFLCHPLPSPVSLSISITFCGCYTTSGDIFWLMQNGRAVAW